MISALLLFLAAVLIVLFNRNFVEAAPDGPLRFLVDASPYIAGALLATAGSRAWSSLERREKRQRQPR